MLKKIFLLFITINLFAISDKLIKPNYPASFIREVKTLNYPQDLNLTIKEDEYNIFLYKGHFRVIYGQENKYSTLTKNFAIDVLDIANEVWEKEVEEYKFKAPRNSQKYYIDIYIGNKGAYNPQDESKVYINSGYAGYTLAYNDRTPYFILNPKMDKGILKVAIAHEFFHTIQYAYGLDIVNDNIWNKNIWFLEASAVLMEDEVYDDINDYVNFIHYYFEYMNQPLDSLGNSREYGKVLFAKYLKEKYGIDFIRKIFENYKIDETLLETIDKVLQKDKNTTFQNAMKEFISWVANESKYFKEGSSYPKPQKYSFYIERYIGQYGFLLFNKGSQNYLISSNPKYYQCDLNANTNKLTDVNKDGLILLNLQSDNIYSSEIVNNNTFDYLKIERGWNLVSNIFDTNLSLSDDFEDIDILWVYRDGKYQAYSSNLKIEKIIKDLNLSMKDKFIYPNEGFWLHSKNPKNITFDKKILAKYDSKKIKKGWNLLSLSNSYYPLDSYSFANTKVIWHYDTNSNKWQYYAPNLNTYRKIPKIKSINPSKGYFIFY